MTDHASPPDSRPAGSSRRAFLLGSGAGVAALSTPLLPASAADATEATDGPTGDGSVVAYVSDVASGEITLLAGGREVVLQDAALARTLARKAR